ncbi:putative disease resistance RPP13-like protein 1 isoform X1 [Quercus lobata]|uniref:putative disease resistance RPP13-like protein 1 isoform X1 n=1 Tax=Quercus lobata TaxID=97700 RepID=UPI0012466FCB|nr:putative disease resistance RPP13-like protein 1 isoform X1 [Quercus lobata]
MAEALVGKAILNATRRVLFDRLASREVLDFIRGRKVSDTLLKKLETSCLALNAVLNDAEEKEITNPAVKKWLDELKDAVYDAEDLLDEIATKALQCQLEAKSKFLQVIQHMDSCSWICSMRLLPYELSLLPLEVPAPPLDQP